MNDPIFKKGEWCFCQFTLHQVTETENDRITGVTDGSFNLSSYDLSDVCFPLEVRVKRISNTVEYYSKQFHEIKPSSLNHPDLNRALIAKWAEMCLNRHDDKKLQELYDSIDEFCRIVISKANELKNQTVGNIRIFR